MGKYREDLPQLNGDMFLTDGGLETTLIFKNGLELPEFAAFDLLKTRQGHDLLYDYFASYASYARDNDLGFILESATWRASAQWGEKLGYSKQTLANMNHRAVELLEEVRNEFESDKSRMVISGCMGPRGDGYHPASAMSVDEAEHYHGEQINTLRETGVDLVSAFTMTNVEEATGLTKAAKSAGLPVVISFTVETDGQLPSGQTLKQAIESVDQTTGLAPAYYMINCAHPTHFDEGLEADEPWVKRIRGLRANASSKSHAELDESLEIDDGNPVELGLQYKALKSKLPNLNVLGGCCGTDLRHVAAVYRACH